MAGSIGLDIGATGVRAVETQSTAHSIKVKSAHALALEPGVFHGDTLADPAGLTAALRILWRNAGFKRQRARLVMGSHPSVLIRAAQIDYLPKKSDRDKLAQIEADKVMPTANGIDSLYIDHHVANVLTRTDLDGVERTYGDIALTGIQRDTLDAILNCMIRAGVYPEHVDVTVFSLSRLLSRASSGASSIDIIVHMGATTVTITGTLAGQFIYQHPINQFSGEQLTSNIADQFMVSMQEAEEAKLAYAKARSTDPFTRTLNPEQVVSQWTTALVREISAAADELTRSMLLPVGRVWLSGGQAGLPSLSSHLSAVLPSHTKVSLLDPVQWVTNPDALRDPVLQHHDLSVALAASLI